MSPDSHVMMRVAGNDIGDPGATSLATALKDNSALKTLAIASRSRDSHVIVRLVVRHSRKCHVIVT